MINLSIRTSSCCCKALLSVTTYVVYAYAGASPCHCLFSTNDSRTQHSHVWQRSVLSIECRTTARLLVGFNLQNATWGMPL